jgi:hypothetical protein
VLSISAIHQLPNSSANENNIQDAQQSLISNQRKNYSSINKPIDIPAEQYPDETPAELENIDAQYHDSNQEDFLGESIKQHQPPESSCNDGPLITTSIQELQITDPIVPVEYPIDKEKHYTSYFYEQTDFNDYTTNDMQPRMPKLFTGKRYIS